MFAETAYIRHAFVDHSPCIPREHIVLIKVGSHRAVDYLATLANSKFVKFTESSLNIPQVPQTLSSFAKRYPSLPNVLLKFWKCSKVTRLFGDPDT